MAKSENKILAMPDFEPLLKVVATPIQADIIAYYRAHPAESLDASLLAGKISQEEIESVQKALAELEDSGVLSSEIKAWVRCLRTRLAASNSAALRSNRALAPCSAPSLAASRL